MLYHGNSGYANAPECTVIYPHAIVAVWPSWYIHCLACFLFTTALCVFIFAQVACCLFLWVRPVDEELLQSPSYCQGCTNSFCSFWHVRGLSSAAVGAFSFCRPALQFVPGAGLAFSGDTCCCFALKAS